MTSLRDFTTFNLVPRFLSLWTLGMNKWGILRFFMWRHGSYCWWPQNKDTDRSRVAFPNGSAGNGILETVFINVGQNIIQCFILVVAILLAWISRRNSFECSFKLILCLLKIKLPMITCVKTNNSWVDISVGCKIWLELVSWSLENGGNVYDINKSVQNTLYATDRRRNWSRLSHKMIFETSRTIT